jgi:capsular exopolysaccharide synthesis family protein
MKDSRELIKQQSVENSQIESRIDTSVPIPNVNYQMYRDEALQEQNPLFEYWRAIRKRLWLVIGITVLFTTLAAIYMARRPNVYMANAIVQVDLENANQDKVDADRRSPVTNSDPAYFNTQLQLLTSDSLLRRTIKELSLDSNKEFQKAKNASGTSPWRGMLRTIGLVSDEDKNDKEGVDEIPLSENTDLVSSEEIADAIRLAPYVEIIKRTISVDPVRESRASFKETRLIAISYRHTDPELAAYVVNGIANVFTQINQEKRTGTGRKTNSFLQERIANLESEVKAGENRLVQLEQSAGILNTDNEQTIVIDRLAGLNEQLLKAEEERKNAEAQFNAVKGSSVRLNAMVEDKMATYLSERETAIRRLSNSNRETIAALKAERKKLLVEYVETAPEIEEIDRKIDVLETEIGKVITENRQGIDKYRRLTANAVLENLRTKYLSAKETEDKIRADFNSQYGQAQGQNMAAVKIRLLKQDIETKRGFLKKLRDSQEGNDVIVAGTDNNISVAEFAIPNDRAVSPRRITTVFAAMLLSLLFGSGLALFLEYLDDTIKSTEEVERYLQLPALAAIPSIDSMPKRKLLLVGAGKEEQDAANQQLLINKDTRSSMAEAYRQLRTSILLSTAGHAPKSLLITSSLPAEGKTTTAVNTAISLAQTGANVLVIDADMRRPRLHSIFSKSNAEGLSTILSNDFEKDEILDIIQRDEESNLFLLPSGPIPPNPAELIGSEQMKKLLDILEANFTHVVIDSPPIASFTDGVLIASLVDGVILVVHAGKSSRQVVHRSRQLLQDIGSKIFGVVLNNVNLRSSDNSYYYQSYYHRDSYNYDDDEQE